MAPWIVTGIAALAGAVLVFLACMRRGVPAGQVAVWSLALGPLAGFGVLSLVEFFARDLLDVTPSWTAVGASAGLLAVVIAIVRFPSWRTATEEPVRRSPLATHEWVFAGLAVFVVVTSAFTFLKAVEVRPQGKWDAMAIWIPRAHMLSRQDGDAGASIQRLVLGHPEYPLMYPATIASLERAAGGEDPAVTQAICLALLFGLALLTYASVSRFASRSVGCAAVALLFSVPHLTERSAALYADVPLGYLFLAANAGMACAFTRRPGVRPPLWLVGFMVALLAWMKQEGAILAAVIAIAAAMTFMFRIRWAGLARLAAGAVVPIVALVLFKSGWSGENKLTQGLAGSSSGSSDAWGVLFDYLVDGERWRITWEHLWKEVATEGTWSAYQEVGTNNQPALKWASLWPALAVTLLLLASWKRLFSNRAIAYAGLSAVGALTAYFLLYVIIPIRQVWHLETSLTRLLLQVLPSLVFFVFALVPLDAVSRDVAFRGRRDDEDGDP